MARLRTRKQKEAPHYNFLYSWQPKDNSGPPVKRESNSISHKHPTKPTHKEIADNQAKDEGSLRIKKDIVRSLITISFILILEVVVYLAWNRFIIK